MRVEIPGMYFSRSKFTKTRIILQSSQFYQQLYVMKLLMLVCTPLQESYHPTQPPFLQDFVSKQYLTISITNVTCT